MIYNDAYSAFAGSRLLGLPVREAWPEVADFNDNVMKVGLAGKTLCYQNQELTLWRSRGPEPVWLNLDYSPIVDEWGAPVGVMAIVVETTGAVRAANQLRENERRLQFLDALGKETSKSTDADIILATTTRMVGEHLGVTSCAYADMDTNQDGFTIRGDWAAPDAVHIVGQVHHKTAHVWTPYELALIKEVTERAWAHIERVRSEAEVREGELRFREELARQVEARTADLVQAEKAIRTVFETLSQGLLTIDGKIVYVNATALANVAANLNDFVGKDFWDAPGSRAPPACPTGFARL